MHLVIIPAAGEGVRFQELGKQYPKCLLPYKNKPIIQHLVEKIKSDLNPDKIVIVRKEKDEHLDLWGCVHDDVEFRRLNESFPSSPVSSIYCGWYQSICSGDFRLTIVLSDMVLSDSFEFPEADQLSTYTEVDHPDRWCFLTSEGKFFNKPNEIPEGGKALVGVYSFSSGKNFVSAIGGCVASKSLEISDAIKVYINHTSHLIVSSSVDSSDIIDLGTLEEFLSIEEQSKCRKFNTVKVSDLYVDKLSSNTQKIKSEENWLSNPPEPYRYRTPQIYPSNCNSSYRMERLSGRNMRNMFLYYNRDLKTWSKIFQDIFSVLNACKSKTVKSRGKEFFWATTLKRFSDRSEGLLNPICKELSRELKDQYYLESPYHGDLHLSNMFWQETNRFKVVDPRGEMSGHWLYDLAKLSHSILGNYDLIEENLYSTVSGKFPTYYSSGLQSLQHMFISQVVTPLLAGAISSRCLRLLTACLFGSLIPLHQGESGCSLFAHECQRFSLSCGLSVDEKSLASLGD